MGIGHRSEIHFILMMVTKKSRQVCDKEQHNGVNHIKLTMTIIYITLWTNVVPTQQGMCEQF
jgi:hypothetical protein